MIIDGHAHISMSDYGNEINYIDQMKIAKIDKALIIVGGLIDVRFMSKYIDGTLKPLPVEPVVDYLESLLKKYPDLFYGFTSVDPHQGQKSIAYVEEGIKKRGFKGLKMAPICHHFAFNDPTVKELAALCGDLGVPFYTHTTFDPVASTFAFEFLVKEFPKTTFILGHMGFGPNDVKATEMVKMYKNLYLETSLGNYLAIKNVIQSAGAEKLIFGSEYPLSHPAVELKKIELQDISDDKKERIFSKNLLNLIE
jgi:hypothetical protein